MGCEGGVDCGGAATDDSPGLQPTSAKIRIVFSGAILVRE
jgi:hypothetical protein